KHEQQCVPLPRRRHTCPQVHPQSVADHRPLNSFPTRRSSDLGDTLTTTAPTPGRPTRPCTAELLTEALATRPPFGRAGSPQVTRSEEHTSELQSHLNLVCRLLLE